MKNFLRVLFFLLFVVIFAYFFIVHREVIPLKVKTKSKVTQTHQVSSSNLPPRPNSNIETESPDQQYLENLEEKWMHDLEDFVVRIDGEKGSERFQSFVRAKEAFWKLSSVIVEKQKATKSKKLRKELSKEWGEAFDRFRENTKTIFGPHYREIKRFHADYQKPIPQGVGDPF